MAHIVKIETKEQFNYLHRIVVNSHRMMHSNTSAYVEYLDIVDALVEAFANAEVIKSPSEEKPPAATTKKKQTAKRSTKVVKLQTFCSVHKTYGAKRAPRTNCSECWEAYKRFNPLQYTQARRKFDRTHKGISQ